MLDELDIYLLSIETKPANASWFGEDEVALYYVLHMQV